MVSNENNEEMSVNDILSSIKEVISSEQDSDKPSDNNEFIELTDVVDEDEEILLEDVVDVRNDSLSNDPAENEEKDNSLSIDNSNLISDLSIDDIVRETIKETLNDWFAKNLKTIVEESVKEEVAKLFKKRN